MQFSPDDWSLIDGAQWTDGVARLGWFTAGDAASLYACDLDEEHRRRFELPAEHVPSMEHALAVIRSWEAGRQQGQRAVFAVRTLSGEPVAGCEVSPRAAEVANLSYWTCPAYRGRGFAQRGVRLACAWLDTLEHFHTVEVLVDPDNSASLRVALACGFEPLGRRDARLLHVKRIGHGRAQARPRGAG